MPSAAFTGIPASMTADGSSSPMRGPAACQKISSMISAGISSRHPVTVFPVGMCQARVNGMSASSPARVRIASEYEEPGSRVIAITRRMTSGYDISRRRSRGRRRPFITALPGDLVDHAVAEMRLQAAEADQVRQPRIRQHRAVPLHERRRGHDRPEEPRLLAFRRRHPGHGDRPGTVNPQVSGTNRQRPRRRPGGRGLRGTNCGIRDRQG